MKGFNKEIIKKAYNAFNARDIDLVISLMHPDVHWPNGWNGGYVNGHDEVRDYWKRQWKEIDPSVDPISLKELKDGRMEIEVHQVVKDLRGKLLIDKIVKHTYTFENGMIRNMEIEKH
ncbi:MAG: nuclear transport factor 2 family protein [Ginsengibacter sp.]